MIIVKIIINFTSVYHLFVLHQKWQRNLTVNVSKNHFSRTYNYFSFSLMNAVNRILPDSFSFALISSKSPDTEQEQQTNCQVFIQQHLVCVWRSLTS